MLMANKAIIPLYINSQLLNNLYTVVVQEFSEKKSISKKEVVSVHYRAPMSEFSYDIFGKYVQGDLEIGFQNEFVKQKTEENISQTVVVLQELRDILKRQEILKQLSQLKDLNNIDEGDYIEFSTTLQTNPTVKSIKSIIDNYEVERIFEREDNREICMQDALINFMSSIKEILNDCTNKRCQRFISYFTTHPSSAVITPLKKSCMLDEDYLFNGKVSIIGKVVRVHRCSELLKGEENKEALSSLKRELSSKSLLDKIDLGSLISKLENRFPGIKNKIYNEDININNLDNIIEVIPISIVI
jgi:hypothetical protein